MTNEIPTARLDKWQKEAEDAYPSMVWINKQAYKEPYYKVSRQAYLSACRKRWEEMQQQESELEEMTKQKDYWFNRCYHAEKFIEASPSDPDITTDQIEAHKNWKESITPTP